jgi:hypothetical protein
LHEFLVGDVVKIVTFAPVHESWRGRIGIITREAGVLQPDTWIVRMDDSGAESWWLSSSLEFLGTEQSLALEVLGEDYFN